MDLFNQKNMNLDEYETKKLLQHIRTNPQFAQSLKNALLMEDNVKVDVILRNKGIR